MAAAAAPPRTRTATRGARVDLPQLAFNGSGRIGRALFFAAFAGVAAAWRLWAATPGEALHAWLRIPVGLVLLAAACAVLSKRLHDVGKAGWWSAAVVGPLALVVAGEGPLDALQSAAGVLALAEVAALALWPGERRFNRFGPSPSERG